MGPRFRHVALIGKYQASGARAQCGALDEVMEGIGAFLESQGCTVFVEQSQAEVVEVSRYKALTVKKSGKSATSASWSEATAPCSALGGSSRHTVFH